eukprot:352852-Chlamydomonas_euryale.AAC.4
MPTRSYSTTGANMDQVGHRDLSNVNPRCWRPYVCTGPPMCPVHSRKVATALLDLNHCLDAWDCLRVLSVAPLKTEGPNAARAQAERPPMQRQTTQNPSILCSPACRVPMLHLPVPLTASPRTAPREPKPSNPWHRSSLPHPHPSNRPCPAAGALHERLQFRKLLLLALLLCAMCARAAPVPPTAPSGDGVPDFSPVECNWWATTRCPEAAAASCVAVPGDSLRGVCVADPPGGNLFPQVRQRNRVCEPPDGADRLAFHSEMLPLRDSSSGAWHHTIHGACPPLPSPCFAKLGVRCSAGPGSL